MLLWDVRLWEFDGNIYSVQGAIYRCCTLSKCLQNMSRHSQCRTLLLKNIIKFHYPLLKPVNLSFSERSNGQSVFRKYLTGFFFLDKGKTNMSNIWRGLWKNEKKVRGLHWETQCEGLWEMWWVTPRMSAIRINPTSPGRLCFGCLEMSPYQSLFFWKYHIIMSRMAEQQGETKVASRLLHMQYMSGIAHCKFDIYC